MATSRDGFEVVNSLLRMDETRRTFLKALGWSAGALAASQAIPFGSVPPAFAQQPKRGGTIKIGIWTNIDTLDPHNTTSIAATAIHNNIYNGILKITYDGKEVRFVPDLAKEWEIIGDRVHVFRLH